MLDTLSGQGSFPVNINIITFLFSKLSTIYLVLLFLWSGPVYFRTGPVTYSTKPVTLCMNPVLTISV